MATIQGFIIPILHIVFNITHEKGRGIITWNGDEKTLKIGQRLKINHYETKFCRAAI